MSVGGTKIHKIRRNWRKLMKNDPNLTGWEKGIVSNESMRKSDQLQMTARKSWEYTLYILPETSDERQKTWTHRVITSHQNSINATIHQL